ncbi:MAG: hypothetical protein HY288_15560, partial [Planctomycetia bacterium]|nr:hypothetical protein [Planctomycetia bacterium]
QPYILSKAKNCPTIGVHLKLRVKRLHFLKTGDDLYNDKKVSDFPLVQPSPSEPGGKISSLETTLEVSKFEESGGARYPSAATITTAKNYENGQRSAARYDMRIDRFKRGGFSASDFAITTVPDGYVVQVQDHPNVEFEWKNGAIVKTLNSETQSRLGSAKFYSTFSIVGYLLVFAICLIAVAYLGSWAYRRRQA